MQTSPLSHLKKVFMLVNCVFVQTESTAVSGGDAGWGERCSPRQHAVGNSDVPVWEEGDPSVSGKILTKQLTGRGNHCR